MIQLWDVLKHIKATIEVYFDAWSNEKPRAIAKQMAGKLNGTRGANLYCDGVLKEVEEWNVKKTLKQFRDS